jgi:hypothetical protein
MPIFFSTLEDAWGNNNYPIEKRKKKCKPKKSADPLCELYGKRYSKISKPYLEMANDNEYQNNFDKYSEDLSLTSMNKNNSSSVSNNKQDYYPLELDEYSSFASINAIETADDDEYLVNALDKVTNYSSANYQRDQQTPTNTLNLTDYDSDSDTETNIPEADSAIQKTNKVDVLKPSDKKEIIQLHNENDLVSKLADSRSDTNYLDFGLYISSGIMLIIMMEKILQLGMLMKN